MNESRINVLRAFFEPLAEKAGLDAAAYAPAEQWETREAGRDHQVTVMRAKGAPDLIFKHIQKPYEPKKFASRVAAQAAAAETLGAGQNRAPAILAYDDIEQSVLMQRASGETLQALCEVSNSPEVFLRTAGEWLAAYHRHSATPAPHFRPKFMLDHIANAITAADEGKRTIPDLPAFRYYAARVRSLARLYDGAPTLSACKHGDFGLRNILIAPDQTNAIDFGVQGTAPVGFDVARLLLHYAETFGDPDDISAGQSIPEPAIASFFSGYDLVGPDDPSVAFLTRMQLLSLWLRVPAGEENRTLMQTLRLGRLRQIVSIALD